MSRLYVCASHIHTRTRTFPLAAGCLFAHPSAITRAQPLSPFLRRRAAATASSSAATARQPSSRALISTSPFSPCSTSSKPNLYFSTRRALHTSSCSRAGARAPMAAETDAQAAAAANTSGITPDSLRATLESKLGAEQVFVEDVSGGCGQSFEAVIVSPAFEKKTTLARHRLVNGALKEEIAAIHAWTPKCYTPAEWEKRGSTTGAGGS